MTSNPLDLSKYQLTTLTGQPTSLTEWTGKVLLIVNVASQCGFTPQYTGLQKLYDRYRERGFAILGFPCNQFGFQEPGEAGAIREFCDTKYSVTFPLFAKVKVNGPEAHPLFQDLRDRAPGLLGTTLIKWNFTKFLVDRSGSVVSRYAPRTEPAKIAEDIETLLGANA